MNTFIRFQKSNPTRADVPLAFQSTSASPVASATLEDLFAGFFNSPSQVRTTAAVEISLDVFENDNAYIVSAAIAGAKKEDIQLEIDKNTIHISAEIKRDPAAPETSRTLQSERQYGKATRRFNVKHELDASAVEAKYADGVLTLTLPKKMLPQPTRININ